jgi:hypothetical protein
MLETIDLHKQLSYEPAQPHQQHDDYVILTLGKIRSNSYWWVRAGSYDSYLYIRD